MNGGGQISASECQRLGGDMMWSAHGQICSANGVPLDLTPEPEPKEYKICQNYLNEWVSGFKIRTEGNREALAPIHSRDRHYFCMKGETEGEALHRLEQGKKEMEKIPGRRIVQWFSRLWYEVKSGDSVGKGHSLSDVLTALQLEKRRTESFLSAGSGSVNRE